MTFAGYQHDIGVPICQCEPPANSFVRYGLWPATPVEPNMAFTMELMIHINHIVMECHVSVYDITKALSLNINLYSKVQIVYKYIIVIKKPAPGFF